MNTVRQYSEDIDQLKKLNSEIASFEQAVPEITKARAERESLEKALKQAKLAEKRAVEQLKTDDDEYVELIKSRDTIRERKEKNEGIIRGDVLDMRLEGADASNIEVAPGFIQESTRINGWSVTEFYQTRQILNWIERMGLHHMIDCSVKPKREYTRQLQAIMWNMAVYSKEDKPPVDWNISLVGVLTEVESNDCE